MWFFIYDFCCWLRSTMLINDVVINKVYLKECKDFSFWKVILEKWDSVYNCELHIWPVFFPVVSWISAFARVSRVALWAALTPTSSSCSLFPLPRLLTDLDFFTHYFTETKCQMEEVRNSSQFLQDKVFFIIAINIKYMSHSYSVWVGSFGQLSTRTNF